MDSSAPGIHDQHVGSCSVAACIPPSAFPSTRDQLMVALVRYHARSSLMWELSRLPAGRTFPDAASVDAALREGRRATPPLEPW